MLHNRLKCRDWACPVWLGKVKLAFGAAWIVGLGFGASAQNQVYEQVFLKNGSVLEGYICEQVPGESVTVQASRATVVASSDSLETVTEREIAVEDLPSEWKKWIMGMPDSNSSMILASLKFTNSTVDDVLLMEQGSEIKYQSLKPMKYHIGWDEMTKSVKARRPAGQFSGIEDVIHRKDGASYHGQITEQLPGITTKILTDDGLISIKANSIEALESTPISESLSVFQQSPLLDRIFVSGSKKPVEGFITSRTLGKDLTIRTLEGEMMTFPLRDVRKYQKFVNPDYKVISDRQLAPGEVVINGDPKNAWFADVESVGGYFVLDEEASMAANVGDEIFLEANLENPNGAIYLINGGYKRNVKLGNKGKLKSRDVFTYQDLVERTLPFERTLSPLGNVNMRFQIATPGDYIISIQGKKGFIIIHVS